MPSDFSLVVCDGPPGDTPGGRYGTLPVMRSLLRPGCVVLLDDVHRSEELEIVNRWADQLGSPFDLTGSERRFASLTLPE